MQIKRSFKLLALSLVLASCSGSGGKEKITVENGENKQEVVNAAQNTSGEQADTTFCGFYVGMFNAEKRDDSKSPMIANKINLSVDSVRNEKIFGHSVVAGNIRPFTGNIVTKSPVLFSVSAKEPGDNKYDGEFTFEIFSNKDMLSGTWKAYDNKLAVTERSFSLMKRIFKYDPDLEFSGDITMSVYESSGKEEAEMITADAGKFNASKVLLTSKDIENMYKRDLEIMRNTIYARHGYSFKNRNMRDFFDSNVDWYIPVSIDVSKELTEIEKQNIALIKRYEKHAESYYDYFGR